MERKKYLLIFLLGFISIGAFGQSNEIFYNAFINGDMEAWKVEIDNMENLHPMADSVKLSLINHQIGYIGWCVGQERYTEAKKYIELSQKHLDHLKKQRYKLSYVASYQGSLDAMKAGVNNFTIIYLGYSIRSDAESSIELNSKNPYGYILLGNIKYYMWAMMGGSKETALEYYKKAEKIMRDESMDRQNWNYLSLMTMIAHAYDEMGQFDIADNYYKNILQFEPDYKWIRDEVYPEFLEKHEQK